MDLTKYMKQSNYLSVKTVNQWNQQQKMVVITGEGEEKTYNEQGKPTQHKWQIPVTRTSDNTQYNWTLSQTAINDLSQELGTDTEKWVGALIKLMIKQVGAGETLTATVIQPLS